MMRNWFALPRQKTETPRRSVRLGVRGVVLDSAGRIFVVRYPYVSGCHLPGGHVEPGESAVSALARALERKYAILLPKEPILHGLFFDAGMQENIVCYVVRDFKLTGPREPDQRAATGGFFAIDQLPAEPSPATRARLDEILHGTSISFAW